ncbi:hypothetical protein [Roseospira visakhapatnamensis]|uniref:Uncharacterized protein n=1 Tax=Roseospira visakhapatnamensis TaxID=390880 RepID=A0A7W6RGI7_9PROT|nr:hypothetical protein [Roseospira visakhapatnamensis]MBB4267629.1 hypothetical protein [Roseospira visakhapatnamensis]
MVATPLLMDALQRIADLEAALRPGSAGNERDLIKADATARRAIAIAQAALDEGTQGDAPVANSPDEFLLRVYYQCGCGHEWSEVHWTEDDGRCPRCDGPCIPAHVELLDAEG